MQISETNQTMQAELEALREEVKRLRESARQYNWLVAAVDNSQDFFGIGHLDGRAIFVNEAGRKLMGIDTLEDVKQTRIPDYFDPQDLPYLEKHILPETFEKGIWKGEFRFRNLKTGALVPVYYSLFVIKDPSSGEVIGLATVTQDLTEQKKTEKLQSDILKAKEALLTEISTPLIPITDEVVVMPLIGTMDTQRAERVLDTLLAGVVNYGAKTVVLDITGVTSVDSTTADALLKAARAAGLLGAKVLLSGVRGQVAQTLVGLDIAIEGIPTFSSLKTAIATATRFTSRAR